MVVFNEKNTSYNYIFDNANDNFTSWLSLCGDAFLYNSILENETREEVTSIQSLLSYPGFFENGSDEFIMNTYFKISFLLDKQNLKFKDGEKISFQFKNSNFISEKPVGYVNSSEDRLKFFFSLEGWKDYLQIKGVHTKDVMLFLKYNLGIPFFFTDDLNTIWDSLTKGRAYNYTSIYLDLEKSKVNNKKYKVNPKIFYYSFSLFDIFEENKVPVEIIYEEKYCSSGVINHLVDLKNRFKNITLIKQ